MPDITPEQLNRRSVGRLPALLGVVVTRVTLSELRAEMPIRPEVRGGAGLPHFGSLLALADIACGYACHAHLPDGVIGFTTTELKSNQLGDVQDGTVDCLVRAAHLGPTTQRWDAVLRHRESGRAVALFRCTQQLLFPKSETP